ncbi:hypothetical protein Hanom_Chr09g00841741 [Helianthus anomalus]
MSYKAAPVGEEIGHLHAQAFSNHVSHLRDTRTYISVLMKENILGGSASHSSGFETTSVEKVWEVKEDFSALNQLHGRVGVDKTVDLETLVDFHILLWIVETRGLFGKFLHAPKISDEDFNLSVFCVGVLVGETRRIKEVIKLKWKEMQFRVLVSEGEGDWLPACIGVPEYSTQVTREGSEVVRNLIDNMEFEASTNPIPEMEVSKSSNNDVECQSPLESFKEGSLPENDGVDANKMFYFTSEEKSKRHRRKKGLVHHKGPIRSGERASSGDFRPKKRSRALLKDNRLGFSLFFLDCRPEGINQDLDKVSNDNKGCPSGDALEKALHTQSDRNEPASGETNVPNSTKVSSSSSEMETNKYHA